MSIFDFDDNDMGCEEAENKIVTTVYRCQLLSAFPCIIVDLQSKILSVLLMETSFHLSIDVTKMLSWV